MHNCTRLFTGLIDRHPDVETCEHWSVPSGLGEKARWEFPTDANPYTGEQEEYKVVIVNRDSNAMDLSCLAADNIKLSAKQSEKCKGFVVERLRPFIAANPDRVVFVSFELLANYKELYLKRMFRTMGLDDHGYDYTFEGTYEFDPKRWFSVDLDIKDTNRKYLKRLSR